ncbi:MAG: FtsX-like permease family protein [Planctomycetota bacterium]|nr:FtsX-like permease family protein [Planctomycetota bacterium]MDA1214485.1 FtsX-like permease family protein [Planctomycetota bacterium]
MYKLLLCIRYVRTRYIALASIISVMLGVATMIVVNSVMSGFSYEMRDRIKGILSDVVIETMTLSGESNPELYQQRVRAAVGDKIAGMTTTVEVYGMLNFWYGGQWITRPVTLIGIDPDEKATVSPLADYLVLNKGNLHGWELPAEAIAHRKEVVEFNRWRKENIIDPPYDDQHHHHEYGPAQFEQEIQQAGHKDTNESPPFEANGNAPPFDSVDDSPFDTNSNHEVEEQGVGPDSKTTADSGRPADSSEHPFEIESATTEPVDPELPQAGLVFIGRQLISYPYEDKKTGKVELVMMVQPGDDVRISTVNSATPPSPTHFVATIVDTFESGMSEYDSNLVFCNLEHLQQVRGMIDPRTGEKGFTSIQIKLKDYHDADAVVDRLKAEFEPGLFSVKTWEQKQGPLLAAVDIESAILNVLLFLIIAVAGFGILAIFYMIVVEKTRDIGILKALGASSNGIMTIFLSYGLALGAVGGGVGVIVGLLFVKYINGIEAFISMIIGRKVFDDRIYYFPSIPTSVNPWMVFWVALGAIVIAMLASILPARRAARLHPVKALRYE